MKIFNIILSIFIFILAAASAVFSYFLFEKRAQFVSGHEKMAKAIYESSKALDAGSGTDEAKKLTPEALAHDKYADLDSLLPGLPNQSKKVIAQRNALAQSLWNIGDTIQMKNLSEVDNFRKADTYSGCMDAVVSEVATTVKRRDNAYRALSDLAGSYRVTIRPQALVSAADIRAVRNIFKPFGDFIQNVIGNSNAYRNALSDVARIAGKRVSVADAKRDAGIKEVKAVVTAKVNEVNTLRGELTKVKRENIRLAGTVRSRDAQIKAAEKKYKEVSNALSELKESIGVAKNYKPWPAGSEEARSRLYGKVTSVSKDYGYFVIDLGERSVVYQESNGKKVPISLKLTSGIELMVVRDAGKADKLLAKPTFVTSSRIVKVGEKESVVELPAGAEVEVGDIVLYKPSK